MKKALCLTLMICGLFVLSGCQTKENYQLTMKIDGTTLNTQVSEGSKVCETKPTKEGYTFLYWLKDGNVCTEDFEITSDTVITAMFEEKVIKTEYEIKFNTDGGNSISSQKVKEGEKVAKPNDPVKEGYVFERWELNGKEYNFDTMVTNSFELKAVYTKEVIKEEENVKTYKVTFNTTGGSSLKTQTIKENGKVSKPSNPTKEGYVFTGWTLNGKTYDFNSVVTKDITLIATWKEAVKYTVTFDSKGGSNVASKTVTEGSVVTKPTTPTREGYTFAGWTLNGKTYDFSSKVTGNITLVATWKEVVKTYTIGITKVDEYSPDRYLTVYEDGVAIKVSKLMYTDGVEIQAAINGTKLSVSNADIAGETTFKVQLTSGKVVTAKVK